MPGSPTRAESGVAPDDFPQAVDWACREGASGFLAGRAVWRSTIGSENEQAMPCCTPCFSVIG